MENNSNAPVRESYSTPTLTEHPPLTDVTGGTGDVK
jgi:hypothetical protein